MVMLHGICNHVIYTPVDKVKNLASSDDEYDSDRNDDILNDTSDSEFSGFVSEDVSSTSDEEIDENPVDWQQKTPFPDTWMKTIMATSPHVRYVLDPSCQTSSTRILPGLWTISVCLFLVKYTRAWQEKPTHTQNSVNKIEVSGIRHGPRHPVRKFAPTWDSKLLWEHLHGTSMRIIGRTMIFLGCVVFKSVMSRNRYAKLT